MLENVQFHKNHIFKKKLINKIQLVHKIYMANIIKYTVYIQKLKRNTRV